VRASLAFVLLGLAATPAARAELSPERAGELVEAYCVACHQGETASAGLNLADFSGVEDVADRPEAWSKLIARVRDLEMPPKGAPAPSIDEREEFVDWAEDALSEAACADGVSPGPAPLRRLNRAEYSATIRDLLNVHIAAGQGLPEDGAGGEGFDNAAETLFLSPLHAEKYLEAARQGLDYAFKDTRSRDSFVITEPDEQTSAEDAARKVLEAFLPRAFRRPATAEELRRYLKLFARSEKNGDSYYQSLQLVLQGVLVSPSFLFRLEQANPDPEPRPLSDYELATRLSYFLWGTMPDRDLFTLARLGELRDPAVLEDHIACMLDSVKTREFAERFIEQWLGTRELGRDIDPDPLLFPEFHDSTLNSAIRYEPIVFFEEILRKNHSLLNLLDSDFTISTKLLQEFYGLPVPEGIRQNPVRVELAPDSRRGGLLGMAAVLAVTSYPERTSPVLRGKWVLEALLGTAPPPPPPDVPELEAADAAAPKTLRARLEAHRADPTCASCHDRMDPIGFGLENFDVVGLWRTEDAGQPIDAAGVLPDGTSIDGVEELKAALLDKKDEFIRHLTAKMLGYALGRGLTFRDLCEVRRIAQRVKEQGYRSHSLLREIVMSVPFQYREGTIANQPAR